MIYKTEFMELYEELSLLNEAKHKKNSEQSKNNQKDIADEIQNILTSNQLYTITDVLGIPKSTSDTGWTFLIPANKVSEFRKQTADFDILLSKELKKIADNVSISGRPHHAKDNILNNGGRSVVELDFGTYTNRNQWRGLGFTATCKEYKYFIIGYLFTKKRQKINADDLEVKTTNRLYDAVVPAFKNLSKS